MTKLNSLKDLFVKELRDVYDAERQIVKKLPKMIKTAASPALAEVLNDHLAVTENQVTRLEEVFSLIDLAPRGKKCAGMEGLLKEGGEMLSQDAEDTVMDAAIIGAAQRVEHYEIAAYGTLASFARELQLDEVVSLLEETLAEEKEADVKLSEISNHINPKAVVGEEDSAERTAI